MTDEQLMQRIKSEAGAVVAFACHSSSVPESFLAALIANETGKEFAAGGLGSASNAKRFEPAVFGHLSTVLVGEQATYGSISTGQLVEYCNMEHVGPPGAFVEGVQLLRSLATSHGLTQIMGYLIMFDGGVWHDTDELVRPTTSLGKSIQLLADFADRFALDLGKDFAELFTCWNTGRPHGKTFDPEYVPNGLARMKLYEGLA